MCVCVCVCACVCEDLECKDLESKKENYKL